MSDTTDKMQASGSIAEVIGQKQRATKIDKIVTQLTSTYYMIKKSSKSNTDKAHVKHDNKLAKRKLKRRRSTTAGHLTDASESSFDSSLIDCFKSLATMNDGDSKLAVTSKTTNKRRRCASSMPSDCYSNRYFLNRNHDCASNKSLKRLQQSARKLTDRQNRKHSMNGQSSNNILLIKETSLKRKNNKYHHGPLSKRMDIEMANCSYLSDVNDQSSVNDDETDVDVEADDEQSDWPVNEPSLKSNKSNVEKANFDEVDDSNRLLNKKTFARPSFPDRFRNIMVSLFLSPPERSVDMGL
jgi:hypothetical protein